MKIIDDPKRLEQLCRQHHLPEIFQHYDRYRQYFHLVTFQKNEIIYQKASQRTYLIFFLKGKIRVCANLSNGKSLLVCFYTTFQLLGDLEFFSVDTSDSTVQAIAPCTCISMHVSEIRKELLSDPVFLCYLANSLAHKLAVSSHNSSINQLYPLENKLASYIIQVQFHGLFVENLTHLAELLGTSYRHLLRTLRSFVDQGILEHTELGYRLLNRSQLEDLAEDLYLSF
ncbi:MAG: cyclic nucleotide-binding domain-containing protein [Lachnospiraceae bacterium]|jgi:CRP-like cAMP-binding protein|nr:cyclic nucleotide-binding domain-containing protein [Lachnospiraceae bacterium]